MKPRRTHSSNAVLKLPGGTEDNDLWIEATHNSEDPAEPVLVSVWELAPEERELIAAGANIELAVHGSAHPPVAMGVTDIPLGKPPDDGAPPEG
jgi:hypothetical protein